MARAATPLRLLRHRSRRDRLAAVFLLALAVFAPPLLMVASSERMAAGLPVLYLWLFGGWAVVIALLAVVAEWPGPPESLGE
jgi:hypothetical protein